MPLVETVPGGPDGSTERFKIKFGARFKKGKKLISCATSPKTCPKGGFPLKAALSFLSGETVSIAYRLPCPQHKL